MLDAASTCSEKCQSEHQISGRTHRKPVESRRIPGTWQIPCLERSGYRPSPWARSRTLHWSLLGWIAGLCCDSLAQMLKTADAPDSCPAAGQEISTIWSNDSSWSSAARVRPQPGMCPVLPGEPVPETGPWASGALALRFPRGTRLFDRDPGSANGRPGRPLHA